MSDDKKKIPVLSIALYVIAGGLVLYTIWALNHSVRYISELVTMGQLTFKGNEYDIINFYMSNSAQYALFAVILFTLGWMMQNISSHKLISQNAKKNRPVSDEVSAKENDEDDFEDWFRNNDQ